MNFNWVYLKLVLVMMFWGTAFVSGRMLSISYHPLSVAFLRFVFAIIILIPFLKLKTGRLFPTKKINYLKFLALGLSGVFAYNYFFLTGLKLVEAGRSSVIIAFNPALTMLLSYFFFKEKLTKTNFLGIFFAMFGAIFVMSKGQFSSLLNGAIGKGELYLLGGVFSWITYTLLGKRFLTKISVYEATTWACIMGALILFPFAIGNGLSQTLSSIKMIDFLNFANLGIFSTCLGFIWYYEGVREIGPSKTSSFINLLPIIGVTSGVVLLKEHPGPTLYIGGIIVIFGIFLVNKKPNKLLIKS